VWALAGMPCGKCLVTMLGLWLPLLTEAGDTDKPFATAQLRTMSTATMDRYLKPSRDRMQIKGHLDDETVAAAAELDRHPHLRR
jgi:hypothetical protein